MAKKFEVKTNEQKAESLVAAIQRLLDAGVAPWSAKYVKQFSAANGPRNFASGHYATGGNVFMAIADSVERGHPTCEYLTLKQARGYKFAKANRPLKGEGFSLYFYKPLEIKNRETGETETIRMLRMYHVFNVACFDGLPVREVPVVVEKPTPTLSEADTAMRGDIAAMGVPILDTPCDTPHYVPASDRIGMPPLASWESAGEYVKTLGHEAIHATGHDKRLKRGLDARFGSPAYAKEELVAEIGANLLCVYHGVSYDQKNSAAYCGHWAKVLRANPKILLAAATPASKAAEYITERVSVGGRAAPVAIAA